MFHYASDMVIVIENMKREGLGSKEEAKARTLKVLFEFVGLKAEEILELGKELKEPPAGRELSDDEIQKASDRKKEQPVPPGSVWQNGGHS